MEMKKTLLIAIIVIVAILTYISIVNISDQTSKVYATSNGRQASDIQLMARAINGEARGESYEGQVAVGAVILNRVRHPSFPNTIAGVIYQSRSLYCRK